MFSRIHDLFGKGGSFTISGMYVIINFENVLLEIFDIQFSFRHPCIGPFWVEVSFRFGEGFTGARY